MLVGALVSLISLTGCSASGSSNTTTVELNSMTVEQIVEKAKEDGKIESVGMPDTWANWDDTWNAITDEYGLTHADTDMSSAE